MKIEEVERAIKKQFEMKDSFKRKLNYWLVQGGYALSAYGKHVLEQVFVKLVLEMFLELFQNMFLSGKMDHILGFNLGSTLFFLKF